MRTVQGMLGPTNQSSYAFLKHQKGHSNSVQLQGSEWSMTNQWVRSSIFFNACGRFRKCHQMVKKRH